MKKTEITKITLTFTTETTDSDVFQKIVSRGYDELEAIGAAIKELKYACCKDFTTPKSCEKGTTIEYFKADGVLLGANDDEEEIADALGWDYAVVFEFNGSKFAVADDFDSYREGGAISSDDVRKFDNWEDVYKSYGEWENETDKCRNAISISNNSYRYYTADREAGNIIEGFDTYEEAEKAIKEYERADKKDKTFEPDFYKIIDAE